jgi:hypothetical protein
MGDRLQIEQPSKFAGFDQPFDAAMGQQVVPI